MMLADPCEGVGRKEGHPGGLYWHPSPYCATGQLEAAPRQWDLSVEGVAPPRMGNQLLRLPIPEISPGMERAPRKRDQGRASKGRVASQSPM